APRPPRQPDLPPGFARPPAPRPHGHNLPASATTSHNPCVQALTGSRPMSQSITPPCCCGDGCGGRLPRPLPAPCPVGLSRHRGVGHALTSPSYPTTLGKQ